MTLHQTINTTDLSLSQYTTEPNSPRNLLTKTKTKIVSGEFFGVSVIEYLSSSSSICHKHPTQIFFYSYLAAEFTKREYLRHYCWSVYILFLCLQSLMLIHFNYVKFFALIILLLLSCWLIRDDATRL